MTYEEKGFITGEKAKEIAFHEIHISNIFLDRLFSPWTDAILGTAVLVRNLAGEPSYWLIPVIIRGIIGGFIRVAGDGHVIHMGVFYRDPMEIKGPPVITGITADEALNRAVDLIHPDQNEEATGPVFVHDGPVGREVWRIEVVRDGIPSRWIFITPAFIYERKAGELKDLDYY